MRQRLLLVCLLLSVFSASAIAASSMMRVQPRRLAPGFFPRTASLFPAPALVLATTSTSQRWAEDGNVKELTASTSAPEILVRCDGRDDTRVLAAASSAAKGGTLVITKGQTCAARDLALTNLRIEDGGFLKPLNSHVITLSKLVAGPFQVFSNAQRGQGTITFSETAQAVNPEWWTANTKPGTTDMTAALQAAIMATGGRGRIFFPKSSYLITDTLNIPALVTSGSQSFSPLVLEGEGPFLSNLINKAPRGKPTLLVNRDLVIVRNLGFWGDDNFPNDAIKISLAGRIYIESNQFFVKGNAIYLERAQSVWIQNNYGVVSAGSSLPPTGVTNRLSSYASPTSSFVFVNLPDRSGYAHHIVIRNNMNEGYNYQVYTENPAQAICLSWEITGNQFESSARGGVKLDSVQSFEISSNYMSEGGGGYPIDLSNCRNGRVGPNYIHVSNIDDKTGAVRLEDSNSITLMGAINRIYLTGSCRAIVAQGTFIDRIQDESRDHQLTLIDSLITDITVPLAVLNTNVGKALWYSDTTGITAYPTVRLGDRIVKTTPVANGSGGWICTAASSAGALRQIAGSGPDPVVLDDYAAPEAYDFRITVLTGGKTGTATYKVEWKPVGAGRYVDLTRTTATSELSHLVKSETGSGPTVSFSIRWPAGPLYVAGDSWSLTSVVPPVWTPISSQ